MTSLRELVGVELGPTSWLEVTQERIETFADATGDPQWIHTDPVRGAEGPFGSTIAHGFLTLSLCVPMLYELLPRGDAMAVNYGVDRVRFPGRYVQGAEFEDASTVVSLEETATGERATLEAAVECESVEKPACVAEIVLLIRP